jgi:hypothetical protein
MTELDDDQRQIIAGADVARRDAVHWAMPRRRPRKAGDEKTIAGAADVAKRYAEYWERAAHGHPFNPFDKDADWFVPAGTAAYWRDLERQIRSMAGTKPKTTRRRKK